MSDDFSTSPALEALDRRLDSLETGSHRASTIFGPDQLATFGSVPAVVVPAPGPGLVAVPDSLALQYLFGSTPYDNSLTLGLVWDGGTNIYVAASVDPNDPTSQFGCSASENQNGATGDIADFENRALTTDPSSGTDLAGGDGHLVVTVLYHLVAV